MAKCCAIAHRADLRSARLTPMMTVLRQIPTLGRGYTYLLSRVCDRAENRAALPLHAGG